MKIGKSNTFKYSSDYWTNDETLRDDADPTTEEDAKFSEFTSFSFNKITVCYNSPSENCWSYKFSRTALCT